MYILCLCCWIVEESMINSEKSNIYFWFLSLLLHWTIENSFCQLCCFVLVVSSTSGSQQNIMPGGMGDDDNRLRKCDGDFPNENINENTNVKCRACKNLFHLPCYDVSFLSSRLFVSKNIVFICDFVCPVWMMNCFYLNVNAKQLEIWMKTRKQ